MEENKKTILLVEDEAVIAMMAKMELEGKGYRVHHIFTGEEAVRTIAEGSLHADLVLMDIDLGGGIDGARAAEQILAHGDIPVVFLSSHTEPEVVEKTERITSYGYVVKNSGIVVMDASIKMALKLFEARMERGLAFQSLDTAKEKLQTTVEVLESTNQELLRTQAELQIKSLHLETFIENAPLAVQLFDRDGHSIYVNKTFCESWPTPPPPEWCFFEDPQALAAGFAGEFERLRQGETITLPELKFRPSRSVPGATDVERYMSVLMFPLKGADGEIERYATIGHDITERKRAEETLRESEEKHRVLVEAAMESIFIAQDGAIRFCNKSFSDFSGYTLEELAERPFTELIHPDDRQMVVDRYIQRLEGKDIPSRYEFRFLNSSGNTRWANMAVSLISWEGKPASLCIAADITDQRAAKEALHKSEERFRHLFEKAVEGILIVRGDTMEFANPAIEHIVGHPLEKLISEPFITFVHPDDREALIYRHRRRMRGDPVETGYDFRIIASDGTVKWVTINSQVIQWDGAPANLSFVTDITDRKAAEEALREGDKRAAAQRSAIVELVLDRMFAGGEITGALNRLAEVLSATLGVARASVWLLSPDGSELRCLTLYEAGGGRHSSGAILPTADFPCYFAAIMAENRIYAGDAQNDPRTAELKVPYLKELGITSMLDAGFFIEGRLAGVVCCEHIGPMRAWHPDEESFISTAASIVAQLFLSSELMTQRERLQSISANVPGIVYQFYALLTGEYGMNYVSRRAVELLEVPADADTFFTDFLDHIHPDDRNVFIASIRDAVTAVSPWHFEGRFVKPSGGIIWFNAVSNPTRLADRIVFDGLFIDITARKTAEIELARKNSELEALNEELAATNEEFEAMNEELIEANELLSTKEKEYRILFENASSGIFIARGDRILMMNPACEKIIGRSVKEVTSRPFTDFLHPQDLEGVVDRYIRIMKGKKVVNKPVRIMTGSGEIRWLELHTTPIDMAGGPASLHYVTDITRRTLAESAMKEAYEKLRLRDEQYGFITANVTDLIAYAGSDGRYRYVSPSCHEILGYDPEDLESVAGLKILHPDDNARVNDLYAGAISRKEQALRYEARLHHKDGRYLPFEVSVKILYDEQGAYSGFLLTGRDITARKKAEEALRESEEKHKAVIETTDTGYLFVDGDGRVIDANAEYVRLSGHTTLDEIRGRSVIDWTAPYDRERNVAEVRNCLATGSVRGLEVDYIDRHGRVTPVEIHATLLKTGDAVRIVTICRDITGRKRVEEEKEKLQGQLLQSQKMESIGRLAGGVAHDFNNMLNVILGHAELALGRVGHDGHLRSDLEEIGKAAQRSADLTRKLLAFARKQTIAPKVLDINETVEGMLTMLRRLIGEDIYLAWKPAGSPWPVRMDPSQLDQVLVNLCVNARDAIAGVGTITIETDNAVLDREYCADHEGFVPGDYLLLTVSDDGCGMDAPTLSHIFEPFFTTREAARGTGLGLATVYGAVKQNKGFINVYSEPGRGTSFKIYLPRHLTGATRRTEEHGLREAARGNETILLVEDEPMILNVAATMLKTLGYTVLAAPTPGEAIRIAREHPGRIDLLMTDVVMPEMNGRDLARNLISLHPDIKRLFMSGYTANVIAHQGVLDEGVHFLQKPFSINDLAAKIREALGG